MTLQKNTHIQIRDIYWYSTGSVREILYSSWVTSIYVIKVCVNNYLHYYQRVDTPAPLGAWHVGDKG